MACRSRSALLPSDMGGVSLSRDCTLRTSLTNGPFVFVVSFSRKEGGSFSKHCGPLLMAILTAIESSQEAPFGKPLNGGETGLARYLKTKINILFFNNNF